MGVSLLPCNDPPLTGAGTTASVEQRRVTITSHTYREDSVNNGYNCVCRWQKLEVVDFNEKLHRPYIGYIVSVVLLLLYTVVTALF